MISHTILKAFLLFYILNGIKGRELSESPALDEKYTDLQREKSKIIPIF